MKHDLMEICKEFVSKKFNIELLYKIGLSAKGIDGDIKYQINELLISDESDKVCYYCDINYQKGVLTIICTDGRELLIDNSDSKSDIKVIYNIDDTEYIKFGVYDTGCNIYKMFGEDFNLFLDDPKIRRKLNQYFKKYKEITFNEEELTILNNVIRKKAYNESKKEFYNTLISRRARRGL